MRTAVIALALALGFAAPAAAKNFTKMPVERGKRSNLEVRVVAYTGGTNGEMIVEIANRGAKSEDFEATGLFFVPQGDPEKAPQRLGAAGPFMVENADGMIRKEKLSVAAGGKIKARLQVFCIDSHRSSPSASHKFRVAKKLLPAKLKAKIASGAKDIIRHNKGDVRKAKPAVQSRIWEERDADWIKLEGERRQEKAPPSQKPMRHPRNVPQDLESPF